ncbi:scarecrow-like protein 32 [Dendrobium catenatum]|uniref:Scarecrow-like protein 32 n=1 Tax=Dendrobium catenatum TaxID=906689 RepID=A0A2I0WPV2_9ASPA|nr:scarecrow-like protein 32 [Dendrobium catenatum]PKU77690.1 Scarecrow-like protein 32 [Dendrobium catenatum]
MQFKETTNQPWPDFFPSSSSSSSSSKSHQLNNLSINSTACMEQLLAHCAHAIDSHDATLAQQLLWVLHNIAPPDGDTNQRLTSAFLRALLLRASRSSCPALSSINHSPPSHLPLSATSLAAFIDLTPCHRFGFSAANSAIAEATDSFPILHIVDLSTTHGMQLPTLIETLAARRPESPPFLRVTIPSLPPDTSPPPALEIPLQELGARLVNFARSRNLAMEFNIVQSTPADGFSSLIEHLRLQQLVAEPGAEALVINSHFMLHFTPDESSAPPNISQSHSNIVPRTMFLNALRGLDPTILIVVEEDADFTACNVVERLRAAFNYMWIPFDAVDSFLPKGGEQRRRYEEAICWKIENAIAQEGLERVERLETRSKWVQRMKGVGFRGVGFGEEAVGELKSMVDEHSAGWGVKKDEEEILVLTWKGHDVLFASAWMPAPPPPPLPAPAPLIL